MRKLLLVSMLSIGACAPAPEDEPAPVLDEDMFGRWDATVLGDASYPMWFELAKQGDVFSGRLQPRAGHALPFEGLTATGASFRAIVSGTLYEGEVDGNSFRGTGSSGDERFEWTAVRAPELAATADPVWGEPMELFNRVDLTGWTTRYPDLENHWQAEDGVLVNAESGSGLMTEATFGDFKLHLEVNVPEGSNSGIYLRGRHEIQVQDDHGKQAHNLNMGGIYGQITPTENAALPANEWQSFDITLLGRWVTVVLNGATIIDHQEIPGITGEALDSNEGDPGPILFQGNHGRILYRNIVLTPTTP